MNSNTFVLELVPIFQQYSKINEQLFIEAILNALTDHFEDNFTINIYPQYQYLSETQSYENVDIDKIKFCFIFAFRNEIYSLYDFITKCYNFKDELSDFINYFTYIGFYTDKYSDLDKISKIKYKLIAKNGDYIEKTRIDRNNSIFNNIIYY